MKSFKTFLAEGATHSTHLEDLILDLGVVGTKHAIDALVDFKTAFSNSRNIKKLISKPSENKSGIRLVREKAG